ncbi:GGDEF domain-containing phosphodiesterase [Paenibacillus sp. YPG26]|uniref:putative bifunctional diguanylate cyclase/phosphodiesterase n=1 Tax=Paenibacillus sp. YPG26 TaxID=2878915 RepID=UPI00203F82B1|nr:GGDEF domain-containing phosphodiesterase [Paenibacillus sp. YPG26]USB33604.1 EAL domain-containing protein [Paenibacillus sp. YPG26]
MDRINLIALFSIIFALVVALGLLVLRYHLKRLHINEERFQISTKGSGAAIWDTLVPSGMYYVSDRWYELMGYTRVEVDGRQDVWELLVHPDDLAEVRRRRREHLEGRTPYFNTEYRMRKKDGDYIWFSVRGKATPAADGRHLRFAGSMIDITEKKLYELRLQMSYDELKASEENYRHLIDAVNDGIWEMDYKKQVLHPSPRLIDMLGCRDQPDFDMIRLFQRIHPDDRRKLKLAALRHIKQKTDYFQVEYRLRQESGRYNWYLGRGKALFNEQGEVYRLAGSNTDIHKMKKVQEELHFLAYYDSLSGLPNRLYMLEDLDRFFRDPAGQAAIFFIDMDNFKFINDTLGHKSGDKLIRQVSQKLTTLLPLKGRLYRLAGDEFVYFIRNVESKEAVLSIADNLIRAFKQPLQINSSNIYATVSIGVACYPEDGEDTEELLKNADVAMYRSKKAGKGVYTIFDRTMHSALAERMNIDKHLRNALDQNEFLLQYQPQMNVQTGRIIGFEALLRWHNPELGRVSPLLFIPVAEDSRTIISIGEWAMTTACAFMRGIHERGYRECRISVNISVIQMVQEDFVSMVLDILNHTELAPQYLELEITESIFMESYEPIIDKLETLRSLGVRIALDDFGTGYSSLSYLKQLPISTLKIDKGFIDNLPEEDKNRSLTEAMIEIGHKMGLEVVAEGVESNQQLMYLREHGCDLIQGYFLSKPVDEDEVEGLLVRY